MRHKVRDLGVFFCLAVMLFTVTSCGKEVSDQTIAAIEQSSEERRHEDRNDGSFFNGESRRGWDARRFSVCGCDPCKN